MGCVNQKVRRQEGSGQKVMVLQGDEAIETLPKIEVTLEACGYKFSIPSMEHKSHEGEELMIKIGQVWKLYDKCVYDYEEHDLDSSIIHLLKIKEVFKQDVKIEHYLKRQKNEQFDKLVKKLMIIEEQYQTMISFDSQIKERQYHQLSNKKGIKVSTRDESGDGVGVKIQSVIDVPFQILISTLIEMDLYKNFMPFVKVSNQEKVPARNCKVGYGQADFPLLTIREAYFQGIGYNRLSTDNTIFLYTRSIHNNQELQTKLDYECKINKEYVQFDFKYVVVKYEPIDEKLGNFWIVMNVDIKLQIVPQWLWHKIIITFGQEFFKNLLDLSKKFKGSQWEKNVQKNPHLFNFFKRIIQEHLQSRQQKQKGQSQKH